MKIACHCGGVIFDQTDNLSNKGHIIPDQDWLTLLDAIDQAVTFSGTTHGQKEGALMKVRKLAVHLSKTIWQCNDCGALYIEGDKNDLVSFTPHNQDNAVPVLSSRNPSF